MIFEEHEHRAWRPPPEETIDQWAERSIILPRGVSSIAGPLSLELTPYLRGPLRSVTDPDVEDIILCTSTQVGKTTFLIIVALYYAVNDPWNMFHVMPTEDEALEAKHERYIPIIRESPELTKFLDKKPRGQLVGDVIRINGCTITFRGSRSASGLASKPGKIAIADEIDKWGFWTGGEADPVDLLGERMKTFHDAKFLKCSTPTTQDNRIWKELVKSSNERFFVPCPICGEYQILVFGDGSKDAPGIKWPEGIRDPDRIDHGNLAWYECEHCHDRIDEKNKRQMLMAGVWAPVKCHVEKDGSISGLQPPKRKKGYHIWAGYSLWPKASWSKIAAQFLKSKDASSSLMNFRNSWLAETWQVTIHELKEERLRDCILPYHQGVVPQGAKTLTVGVDVQQAGNNTYQYYAIRAWGNNGESWLMRAGIASNWKDLYAALFDSQYLDQGGNPVGIEIVLVDSGFATNEVYQFCELYGCWASKGDARIQRPFVPTEAETIKGSDRWLRRVNVNTDHFKSQLHSMIQGGKWHLPEDLLDEYFKHMVAEQIISEVDKHSGKARYRWKVLAQGRPNHYLDCEVLALVGAEMLEVRYKYDPRVAASQEQMRQNEPIRIVSKVFT